MSIYKCDRCDSFGYNMNMLSATPDLDGSGVKSPPSNPEVSSSYVSWVGFTSPTVWIYVHAQAVNVREHFLDLIWLDKLRSNYYNRLTGRHEKHDFGHTKEISH